MQRHKTKEVEWNLETTQVIVREYNDVDKEIKNLLSKLTVCTNSIVLSKSVRKSSFVQKNNDVK